jgi:Ni,Fe-hydrogenase I cytochrome b subunit
MVFDRLTWIGLMVVALGWALLLSGAPSVEILTKLLGRGDLPFNMVVIAQMTILTGFGLAVLGALQTGFGALKNFFDTVLERTARNGEQQTTQTSRIVERGRLRDRPFVRFGDGTVEVETLLGLRRFASLKDAHEFIGR